MTNVGEYVAMFPYFIIVDKRIPTNPSTGIPQFIPSAILVEDRDSTTCLPLLKELEHVASYLDFFTKDKSMFVAVGVTSGQIGHILTSMHAVRNSNIDLLFEPNHSMKFSGWRLDYDRAILLQ
jgi:hypothetical protein